MKNFFFPIALLLAIGFLDSACCKQPEEPLNIVNLYDGLDGKLLELSISITNDLKEEAYLNLDTRGADNLKSSVRWNLAPGVKVILYSEKNGGGLNYPLEGSGFLNLVEVGLDKKVSSLKFQYI